MGPNPNEFFCGFPSGLAHVTVQVATSSPLSRHHPCRDINLSLCSFELVSSYVVTSIPCRDISSCLCSFELVVPEVATSVPCRDISSYLWRLQLVAPDVATSISCRDINLMNYNFQLMVPDVATSIPCRDIISYLCSFQLMSSVVATSLHASAGFNWLLLVSRQQLKSHQFHLFNPVIASRRFSCRDLHPLSRHQPLSRHHDAVATSFL